MSEIEDTTIHLTVDDVPHGTSDETPQTVDMSVIEETARQQGWAPDKGDLGALEFLGKGRDFRDNLYNEVKELRAENKKVYGMVAESITKQEKVVYENDFDEWEAKIDAATGDGDVELARNLRRNPPQTPPPQQVEDPNMTFIEEWKEDNDWFENDRKLTIVEK